ncbi:Hypothetical predicted protein [Mytilus galloprovincialis]|uniref:Uncharacterized protein n=1 Tax=Mytilus galloprovincialis TaxID=29158 RepID=A0A8B6HKG4_MYTGA|nr:Hypothetical predicted protein [Mytilus galloprovincialis]
MTERVQYRSLSQEDTDDELLGDHEVTNESAVTILADDETGTISGSNVRLTEASSSFINHKRIKECICKPKNRKYIAIGILITTFVIVFLILLVVRLANMNLKHTVHDPDKHSKANVSSNG